MEQLPKAAVKYKLQTEITDKQHVDTLKQWTSPAPWEPSFLKEKRPKKEGGEKGDRLKIEDDERLDEKSGGDLKVKSKSKQKAVKDVKDVKEVKMNTAVHVQIILYRSVEFSDMTYTCRDRRLRAGHRSWRLCILQAGKTCAHGANQLN